MKTIMEVKQALRRAGTLKVSFIGTKKASQHSIVADKKTSR